VGSKTALTLLWLKVYGATRKFSLFVRTTFRKPETTPKLGE
jgi:hypothetical protein